MIKLLEGHKYSDVFKDLVFFIETAKIVFREMAPSKFMMYGGNCCRQSAFLCHMYLSKHIPEYKWEICESNFKSVSSAFEHSWCFGYKDDKTDGIFVDLAYSNGMMDNFLFEGSNDFPGDISLIDAGCREIKTMRKTMPIRFYLESDEFYTGLNGAELFDSISSFVQIRKDYISKKAGE